MQIIQPQKPSLNLIEITQALRKVKIKKSSVLEDFNFQSISELKVEY